MKNRHLLPALLITAILLFASYKSTYFLKVNYKSITVKEAVEFELKNNSKEILLDFPVELKSNLYPNKKKYTLLQPKTFLRLGDPLFETKVEYYYTAKDSVKAILYQLNYADQTINTSPHSHKEKMKLFQQRFEDIEDNITTELGGASSYNLESKRLVTNFRDEIKWINVDGINVTLFLSGNEAIGYGQIQMIIYRE